MKVVKIIVASVMWIAVLGLGYWLYRIIQDPVEYQQAFKENKAATITRINDIKNAQSYYLDVHGEYAKNFDQLIGGIQNDSIQVVKTIGDQDDTTVVTTFDTIRFAVIDTFMMKSGTDVNNLRYVPGSEGATFTMDAKILKEQRVEVPVFEVIAERAKYLKGLNQEFVDLEEDLIYGSLNQAKESGNWE